MKKIYIANAMLFDELGRQTLEQKIVPILTSQGYQALNPWYLTDPKKLQEVMSYPYGPERKKKWQDLNIEMFNNNKHAIQTCDGVLLILDGGGLDPDSGLSWECGYAFALKKSLVGFRTDIRMAGDNEGSDFNLMLEQSIIQSGGSICTDINNLPEVCKSTFR